MMPDEDEFCSVSDAAKLLFVSRPFARKLVEQGRLEVHHKTADDEFVTCASVLRYQADQEAARQAYQNLAGKGE
jgi:hypothetical protein